MTANTAITVTPAETSIDQATMKKSYSLLILCTSITLCLVSCEKEPSTTVEEDGLPTVIVACMPQPTVTKTDYAEDDEGLKTTWKEGDCITISPAYKLAYASTYKLSSGEGTDTGTFTFQSGSDGGSTTTVSTSSWGVYYPGDKIKSDVQYYNFSYEGQVQDVSSEMAHLGEYHSIKQSYTSENRGTFPATQVISFGSSTQSSCLRLNLSGMTFKSPSKITVNLVSNGFVSPVFYSTNCLPSGASYHIDDVTTLQCKTSDCLTLGLAGYGDVTSLTARMMMSDASVTFPSGSYLLLRVTCSDATYYTKIPVTSAINISGGTYLTLNASKGWKVCPAIDETEYDFDGEVVTLQEHTQGSGIDLVIMGDGFKAADFLDGNDQTSTYAVAMRRVYEAYFSVYPVKQWQSLFNVYYVKAVSPQRFSGLTALQNGAKGGGNITRFSTTFTVDATSADGNTDLVREYARKALATDTETRMKTAQIIVLANAANVHAGTCHSYSDSDPASDYGYAHSISYFPLGNSDDDFTALVRHEACGHGLGMLADEYYYNSYYPDPTNPWKNLDYQHSIGFYRNVDKYYGGVRGQSSASTFADVSETTSSSVYWSDLFGTANAYETSESLGFFEGAYVYLYYFCRPTEVGSESIMYNGTDRFNAPSRRMIYYRMMRLSGLKAYNWGSSEEIADFLEWDGANRPVTAAATSSGGSQSSAAYLEGDNVLHAGIWADDKFLEN